MDWNISCRVYQIGFDFLFPGLAKEQWNVETNALEAKGDIVESVLGYGRLMELAPTNIKKTMAACSALAPPCSESRDRE